MHRSPNLSEEMVKKAKEINAARQFAFAETFLKQKEYAKAVQCFRLAAEQNHTEAQYQLGMLYKKGRGVSQNYHEAYEWLIRAANNNHAKACISIGRYHQLNKNYLKMIECYQLGYQHGFSVYPQDVIIGFLIHFLQDPRYKFDAEGKRRVSDEAINDLIEGQCSGLTARFLVGAFIEKNGHLIKKENEMKKASSIEDNLTQFHRDLDTITKWDGKRDLTPEEQKQFFTFFYLMFGYQNAFFFKKQSQEKLESYIFINDQLASFKLEIGCTLCVTQEQFAAKLDMLRKPNRMMFIGTQFHAVGVFGNYYFGPNNYEKNENLSSADIAKKIFAEMAELLTHFSAEKPLVISIDNFAYTEECQLVSYPCYDEIHADCAPSSKANIDEKTHSALQQAARNGHVESLKYFLKKDRCFINLPKTPLALAALGGNLDCIELLLATQLCDINLTMQSSLYFYGRYSAFHCACRYDQLDAARLLLSHGAELNSPSGLRWTRFNPNPDYKSTLQNIDLLKQESQKSLASNQMQYWIQKYLVSERLAIAFDPDQRFVLEKITDIANQLNLLAFITEPITGFFSIDTILRKTLEMLKSKTHQAIDESKQQSEEINAFFEAVSSITIATASMNQIRSTLEKSFCKMPSCQIAASEFNKIATAYDARKNKITSTSSSSESKIALDAMRIEASRDPVNCALIALSFIKTHPTKELAKQIMAVVPKLGK